jgi:xanthine dehydrogenase accessory factor
LAQGDAILIRVAEVKGSGPREEGAWMAVWPGAIVNTIGGGRLELDAIQHARNLLKQNAGPHWGEPAEVQRMALGPSLGQCCGGVVHVAYQRIAAKDWPQVEALLRPKLQPIALFGGGHVGRALVRAMAPLAFEVRWIDSRDEIFPPEVPANVYCEHSDPVQAAVRELMPGTAVLIMSFSHAEDLDVVDACLQRQRNEGDLPYVGLIGSKTKWATFRHRLEARGWQAAELSHVTCPIGLPEISGKEPEVVAASTVAQLLIELRDPSESGSEG